MTEGSILVDGVDIREVKQSDLRDKLGYVPQKGVLFSGTIDSNLRYGKEDASEEEVKKAARIAQAADFIEEKKEAYDSPIAPGRFKRIRRAETETVHCQGGRQRSADLYF